jgi:hypothetical protein
MGIRLKAPWATTVIACIALFLALGGGGYFAFAHGGAHAAKKKAKAKAGPPGPQGPQGVQGPPGPAGVATAIVHWFDSDGGQANVALVGADTTPGVSVTRCQTHGGGTAGQYLIDLPAGITFHNVQVTPDGSDSASADWTATALPDGGVGGECTGDKGDVLVSIANVGTPRASGAYVLFN